MREASCAESWSRETGGGMQCRRGAWSIDQYMYVCLKLHAWVSFKGRQETLPREVGKARLGSVMKRAPALTQEFQCLGWRFSA